MDGHIQLHNYTRNLIAATQWLLSQQHRDGSWGQTLTEKVRWTANAVYSLHLLGLDPQSNEIQQATTWLKHIPVSHPEWYLRIQPLMAVGLSTWLEQEKDLERVGLLFHTDTIGPLPIKVAVALELLKEGITIPNLDSIERAVIVTLRHEEGGLASFSGSTNDTTLYCSFLGKIDYAKYQDTIRRCLRWVMLRHTEKPHLNAICWEESYGKTAYVILNLLDIPDGVGKHDALLAKSVAFFQPKPHGAIPEDVLPAHDSHSSVYTTILFIRLYAAIMQETLDIYRKAFGELICEAWLRNQRVRSLFLMSFWGLSLTGFLLTGSIMYFVLGKEFILSVVASLVPAALPSLFVLARRLHAFLFGG